jgi:hypothetical protein
MMSRYREVADIVLKYLDHKDRLVRLSITALLPRIAHFLRDRFVTNYLKVFFLISRQKSIQILVGADSSLSQKVIFFKDRFYILSNAYESH